MSIAPESSPSLDTSSTACPNCEKPDYAANGWCRFCGYYGVLGKCVEFASWEQDLADGELTSGDPATQEHPWIEAIKAIPTWAWYLLGTLAIVTFVNVVVRINTVPGGAYHLLASAAILFGGLLVAVSTHLYAGLLQMREDEHCSLSDVLLHPIQIWCAVVLQMPATLKRVTLLWGGVWTVILVHVIVGVPYFQFIDLAAQPKQPESLVNPGDIVSAAASASTGDKDLTMEEALDAFAAELPEDGLGDAPTERLTLKEAFRKLTSDLANLPETITAEPEPEYVTKLLDAVVVGFQVDQETGVMNALVLAVKAKNQLRVIGAVSQGVTPEIVKSLQSRMAPILRDKPSVKSTLDAFWVEPVLRCRIQADYSKQQDRFQAVKLLKIK